MDGKASFSSVVGLLMFDFELDLIEYVLVVDWVGWMVAMTGMLGVAAKCSSLSLKALIAALGARCHGLYIKLLPTIIKWMFEGLLTLLYFIWHFFLIWVMNFLRYLFFCVNAWKSIQSKYSDQVDNFSPAALIALRFLQSANLIKFSSLFYKEKKLEQGTMTTPSSKAIW